MRWVSAAVGPQPTAIKQEEVASPDHAYQRFNFISF